MLLWSVIPEEIVFYGFNEGNSGVENINHKMENRDKNIRYNHLPPSTNPKDYLNFK